MCTGEARVRRRARRPLPCSGLALLSLRARARRRDPRARSYYAWAPTWSTTNIGNVREGIFARLRARGLVRDERVVVHAAAVQPVDRRAARGLSLIHI